MRYVAKVVRFNEKGACRVIAKDNITILTPLTQPGEAEYLSTNLETEDTQIIDETAVVSPTSNIEAIEKLLVTFVKPIENRLFISKVD